MKLTGIVLVLFMLSGCHTVSGIGQDLQAGGKELQKAAQPKHQTQTSNLNQN